MTIIYGNTESLRIFSTLTVLEFRCIASYLARLSLGFIFQGEIPFPYFICSQKLYTTVVERLDIHQCDRKVMVIKKAEKFFIVAMEM